MLIEFRESRIHGLGGFALARISAGARIIEYLGERIDKRESLRRCQRNNAFIFYLSPELDLDGSVPDNPARWLNHSCDANADAELIEGRIWIVARRTIEAGEEVTFDYGYDLEEFRDHPCHCGSPQCTGYILAEVYRDRFYLESSSSRVVN